MHKLIEPLEAIRRIHYMPTTTQGNTPEIEAAMLLIHRGTEYFLRKVNDLRDEEFDEPSLLPEWSRRHVIAHVSYNAEGICRLLDWARTGIETPAYASAEARAREIEIGATLGPPTLRKLYEDSAARLDRQWRDLPRETWSAEIVVQGQAVPTSTTLWRRTREVWLHAVDLNNGASFTDFPAELIDRLLADVVSTWRQRKSADDIPNFVLVPGDRDTPQAVGDPDAPHAIVLRGAASALASWATGRGSDGVSSSSPGGTVPTAPRWL
jgi:maleylpyruvate isomerase